MIIEFTPTPAKIDKTTSVPLPPIESFASRMNRFLHAPAISSNVQREQVNILMDTPTTSNIQLEKNNSPPIPSPEKTQNLETQSQEPSCLKV